MNNDPKQIIATIAQHLKDCEQRGRKKYFTVKIEIAGTFAEKAFREYGAEKFLAVMKNILTKNKPDQVIVEVHTDKSRINKDPESTWQFYLTPGQAGQLNQAIQLSGIENPQLVKSEAFTDPEQHYRDKLELQRVGMSAEFGKQMLEMELKLKNEKIEELKAEVKDQEQYISQLETQLQGRPQFTGLGGINLLDMGSYMLEGFIKRNPKILKSAFNLSDEQVAGLFSEQQNGQAVNQPAPQVGQATATVTATEQQENLSTDEKQRLDAISKLNNFLSALPSPLLKKVYNIMAAIQNNENLADEFLNIANANNNQQNG